MELILKTEFNDISPQGNIVKFNIGDDVSGISETPIEYLKKWNLGEDVEIIKAEKPKKGSK